MDNEKEKVEIEEQDKEEENPITEIIDHEAFALGISHASYLGGLAYGMKKMSGLPDKAITSIIVNKIVLEYQKEMNRMEIESREYIVTHYAENDILFGKE